MIISTVVYREAATSPIPWSTPVAQTKPLTKSTSGVEKSARGQLIILKQRVSNLTQQLVAFKDAKAVALKKFAELKSTNEQLATDLNLANQRLKTARLTCQVIYFSVVVTIKCKLTLSW